MITFFCKNSIRLYYLLGLLIFSNTICITSDELILISPTRSILKQQSFSTNLTKKKNVRFNLVDLDKQGNDSWAKYFEPLFNSTIIVANITLGIKIFNSPFKDLDTSRSLTLLLSTYTAFKVANYLSGFLHAAENALPKNKVKNKIAKKTSTVLLNQHLIRRLKPTLFPASYRHHTDPQRILGLSYWQKTRGYYLCLIPILGVSVRVKGIFGFTIAMTGLILANSEFTHSIAHGQYKDNFLIKFAKKQRWILSEEEHYKHHYGDELEGVEPFSRYHCLIQGDSANKNLNLMLDLIGYQSFEERIE